VLNTLGRPVSGQPFIFVVEKDFVIIFFLLLNVTFVFLIIFSVWQSVVKLTEVICTLKFTVVILIIDILVEVHFLIGLLCTIFTSSFLLMMVKIMMLFSNWACTPLLLRSAHTSSKPIVPS
jgi:hypothetical protein